MSFINKAPATVVVKCQKRVLTFVQFKNCRAFYLPKMNRARGISKKRHSVPEGQLINDVTRAVGAPMKHNMHRSQVAAPVASVSARHHTLSFAPTPTRPRRSRR